MSLRNKAYKMNVTRYSVDYTVMATKARLPETERHWLRVLGTLNEAQARVFVAQKAPRRRARGGESSGPTDEHVAA